jgi:hypothetical protein
MKAFFFAVASLVLFGSVTYAAEASTYVRGYYRSSGTYVSSHYRSTSDRSFSNNWSTRGNYNPYTGSKGYRSYPSSSYRSTYRSWY